MGNRLKEADVKRQEKGTGSDHPPFPESERIKLIQFYRLKCTQKLKSWEID
ncbi:MAG: hypothetical protein AB8B56_03950 [Crocinitomicaceae bacterium]